MLLPLSGLLAGVKPRKKWLALVILYSDNPKVILFLALALLPLIKAHFVAHMVLPLSGLLAGVKPRVKLLALAIPYSGNPKVRYDTVFSLGPFNLNKAHFVAHMLLPLSGLLAGVKPRVKLLALSISYAFSLDPFNINKWFFWVLQSSKGDFGVNAPPQACQQNFSGYWRLLKSTHEVKHFAPFHMNKRPGLPVYVVRKLQVAILARSFREMSPTVRIDWHSFLPRVRISVRRSKFFIDENLLRKPNRRTSGQLNEPAMVVTATADLFSVHIPCMCNLFFFLHNYLEIWNLNEDNEHSSIS